MKWPLVGVAFVLGAAVTWFVTVKRVTLVVPAGGPATGGADLPAADGSGSSADAEDVDDVEGVEDDPSAFGGARTATSEASGAAEAWDRDAEDEDALMSGRTHEAAQEPDHEPGDLSVPPVADATPNGDLAGVGDPDEVAAVDEQAEQHTETPKAP
jgi:hypothetical protein